MDMLTTTSVVDVAGAAGRSTFNWRNPAGTRVAAIISAGAHGNRAQISDTLTGYGRPEGYNSLANARRAAYMLTRGDHRSAAGIFQQGERFYVRALGEVTHHAGALLGLHFEKAAAGVALLALQDPRLRMLVDGSSKVFAV